MWSLRLPTPRPGADLHRHGARDHVARGEVLGRGRVALHEALAFRIGEVAALAARALGDEAAGAVDAGRVELHELHVLQRQAGAQHHGVAVARAGVGRGRREIRASVAARRQDRHVGAEAVDLARRHVERDDAAAAALLVHDQVEGEILDEEVGLVAHRLAVEGVQHGVAGAVGGRAGALGGALAVIRWSCRRRGAGRSCPRRCARTARPSAPARRPRRARCGTGTRSRPGRRASPTPSRCRTCASASRPGPCCRARPRCRPAPRRCASGSGTPWSGRRCAGPPASSRRWRAGPRRPRPTTTTSKVWSTIGRPRR